LPFKIENEKISIFNDFSLKMGIPEFYKLFISEKIPEALSSLPSDIYGISVDMNGIIHRVAGEVFGYGRKEDGKEYSESERRAIFLIYENNYERLHLQFLQRLKDVLYQLFIAADLTPLYYLIISVDGIAPFAKICQQRNRRFASGKDRYENLERKVEDYSVIDRNLGNHKYFPSKFDTATITTGTKFMADIDITIQSWFTQYSKQLPRYCIYSSDSVQGEGEHKIFNILEKLQEKIRESDNIEKFNQGKHLIYGLDADLCLLTMKSPLSFYWVRESFELFKIDSVISIEAVKNYVYLKMRYDDQEDYKLYYVLDFILLSFLIGDDFVPGIFTLDLNVGVTLDKICETYQKVFSKMAAEDYNFHFISEPTSPGRINWNHLGSFISAFQKVEKKMYEEKIENQKSELLNSNEVRRSYNHKYGKYTPSPMLGNDISNFVYEDFLNRWIQIIIAPEMMSVYQFNFTSSRPNLQDAYRSHVLKEMQKFTESDLLFIVADYLTGLQWNLAYYCGYSINNWHYKSSLSPCIGNINKFLSNSDFLSLLPTLENILFSGTSCNSSQQLFTVLHPVFSREIIVKEKIKGYDIKGGKVSLKNPIFSTYFPIDFPVINYGKYSTQHNRVTVLSKIELNLIQQYITNKTKKIVGNYEYVGERRNEERPNSRIVFSVQNQVQEIPKVSRGKVRSLSPGPPRRENPSGESSRRENTYRETPRREPPRREPPRREPPRREPPRREKSSGESSRKFEENPYHESSRKDSPRKETPRESQSIQTDTGNYIFTSADDI
jgi:5'-3' exonuclease